MSDKLTHHGVKGMKWGIRKNRKSKIARKSNSTSSKTKKVLKTAAIVAGVGATAIGAAFLARKFNQNRMNQPVSGLKALESTEKLVNDLLIKASDRPAFEVNSLGTATRVQSSKNAYSNLKKMIDGMDNRSAINLLRNEANPTVRVATAQARGELFTKLFEDKTITSAEASRRFSEANALINRSLQEYVRF